MSKDAFGVAILSLGVLMVALRAPMARFISQFNSYLGAKADEAVSRRTAVVIGVLEILWGLLTLTGILPVWGKR